MTAITATATRTYALSVCVDCFMAAHGALDASDPAAATALSLITEGRVIPACVACESCGHDDCANGAACECGYGDAGHGFSWTACDGCGSTLGGDRYGLGVDA